MNGAARIGRIPSSRALILIASCSGTRSFVMKATANSREVSDELNTETYWPWGVSVGDLNADGFDDIFVTAGMLISFRYSINSVLLNDAGQKFFDAEFLVGVEPRSAQNVFRDQFTLDCDGADKDNPLSRGHTGQRTIGVAWQVQDRRRFLTSMTMGRWTS